MTVISDEMVEKAAVAMDAKTKWRFWVSFRECARAALEAVVHDIQAASQQNIIDATERHYSRDKFVLDARIAGLKEALEIAEKNPIYFESALEAHIASLSPKEKE
jgi:LPS O-antigen subunit length determinant protein (WzzB/FepE family)